MERLPYETPRIVEEREFETQAMHCGKVPGLSDPCFCGQVWAGPHGHKPGCFRNGNSRSS